MDRDQQQVLELVLPYVHDAATLLTCSMASTDVKGHAQHAARQNLPALLGSCPDSARYNRVDSSGPMQWLCSFAGSKAVNTYEAGCALLTKVLEEDPPLAADYMAKAGLQLTGPLLLFLMSHKPPAQGPKSPALLALHMERKGAAEHVPHLYMECATWGWYWRVQLTQMDGMVFARQEPKPPDYLIARVKPKQLPDVLRLLVRRAACEASAADAAIALLEHDRKELHVLHSSSSNCGGAAGGSRDAPAGGSSRRSSSSGSGDGLPGWYLTWLSKGSKAARDQQQWRMSDDAAVQLVEELLGVSVTYNLSSLCQALAALPPAQYIGPATVTQLLYVAFMQIKKAQWYKGPAEDVVKALTGLPGAAGVSPGCLINLVRMCAVRGDCSKLGPVLQLPCAQRLSSKQVCKLVDAAGRDQRLWSLVPQLCRMADGRKLEAGDVMQLVEECINKPWCDKIGAVHKALLLLAPLKPGRHISGDNLLQLMLLCAEEQRDWAAVLTMADWEPAAGAASDVPLLVSVLRAAAGSASCFGNNLMTLFEKLPLSRQLQRSDWLEILQSGLRWEGYNRQPLMPWALGLQPELRDMSAEELTSLLEAAARANSAQEVAVLTGLPAAQQLQEEDVERILTGTKVRLKMELLKSVAALPAAQQLSGPAYLRVLRAGAQQSDVWRWEGLKVLLQLPAAQQLDAAALGELLAVAADKGTHTLPDLTALPVAQQLQPDVVFGVLQQLVRRLAKKSSMGGLEVDVAFVPLLQLQPAQQIPLESLQQLFDAVTDLGPKGGNLPDLIRKLPQAAGLQERLSLKRLLPLLRQAYGCTDRYSYMRTGIKPAEALRLLQEPAAQELSGSDLVELLKEATISGSDSIFAGLQALPGFKQLRSKDLLRLMRTAMIDSGSRRCIPLMDSYADHPAAAAVTEAEVMVLLTTGVEHNSDVPEFFAALLRVPAGRQLGKQQVMRLVRTAIDKQCEAALPVLLASPGGQALDAAAALELVRDAGGLGPYAGGPGFKSVRRARIMVSAVLAGLPKAVAQFSRQQIQGLLFEALGPGADSLAPQPGADAVQIVLAQHFAVRYSGQGGGAAAAVEGAEQEDGGAVSGASSGDAELAAMCGAMRLLEGRTYPFPHDLL